MFRWQAARPVAARKPVAAFSVGLYDVITMQPDEPNTPPATYAHPGYSQYTTSSSPGGVSPLVLEHLRRTKPWVTLFGVLMFVASALIFLAAFAMLAMAVVGHQVPGFTGGLSFWMGAVYFTLSILYIAPAIYLKRYASSIGRLMQCPSMNELETALAHQTAFWRFIGIMTVVTLALYAGILLIAGFAAAVGLAAGA